MVKQQESCLSLAARDPVSEMRTPQVKREAFAWSERASMNPLNICRAAQPSGCARCGAGAGCSAIKYQSPLNMVGVGQVEAPKKVEAKKVEAPKVHPLSLCSLTGVPRS